MPKTTVINGTDKPLALKEGTAGIFTLLKKLQPNESYQIVVDTNATYREYWCAVKDDDPDGVVLSSDDCEDLKEVTIIETGTKPNTKFSYKGVNRESTTEEPSSSKTTKHGGPMTWLRGFFKKPEKGSPSKSPV